MIVEAPKKTDESAKIVMTRIGYARVSTVEQELALQLDALRAAGCDRIFEGRASITDFELTSISPCPRF